MTRIHPAPGSGSGSGGPVRPRDHAETAAEAIRALNHATLRHGDPAGYQWPSDVDSVIAELQILAERLPQALRQAREWLTDQLVAGRVGHDTPGRKADFATAVAVGHLNEAEFCADTLARILSQARRESCHLTGLTSEPDGTPEGGEW